MIRLLQRPTLFPYTTLFRSGKLEGSARVASVDIDEPQLAGHLQTPDFFDAEQHPELRFTANGIEREGDAVTRSEEHTSELQSPCNLVCSLLLEKKKKTQSHI